MLVTYLECTYQHCSAFPSDAPYIEQTKGKLTPQNTHTKKPKAIAIGHSMPYMRLDIRAKVTNTMPQYAKQKTTRSIFFQNTH